jgi:hypothetical protein
MMIFYQAFETYLSRKTLVLLDERPDSNVGVCPARRGFQKRIDWRKPEV